MGKISKSLRFEILTRDGYQCRYCGTSAQNTVLHIDHVLPRSAGGQDASENLVTACIDCNFGKSDRQVIGLPEGFALSPDKRPARLAKMRQAKCEVASKNEHILNCDDIDDWDELNGDSQLVWVWCRVHSKYEWHSIPIDLVEGGGTYRTERRPVEW